ncbi:MAG: carbohydrate ABC transporter permease, partial [Caldilineaceae bacterium]|nr:carbohydrate ABC transporter permease [Caldilineaceae bacterium]
MANQDFVGVPSQVDTQALSRGATDFQRLSRGLLFNYIILGAGAILMVVPFIWMISTSFKPQAETVSFPPRLLPINPTISNYIDVFDRANMGRLYWNTTFVSVIKTIFNIYTSALLGYIFGKFVFRGRDIIFYILLSTWIIPFEVYLIPLYLMTVQVGWADTYTALIVPEIFTIYAMFMFRQFMYTIPTELVDAARIDGAGEWYIFHRIIIPLSRAALFTLIAFYFMWNWNDFLWPLVVISSHDKYVITVGLATF